MERQVQVECHIFSQVKPVRADRDDVAVLLDDVIELVAQVRQLFPAGLALAVPVKEKDEVVPAPVARQVNIVVRDVPALKSGAMSPTSTFPRMRYM